MKPKELPPEEYDEVEAAVGRLWIPDEVFTERELRLIVNCQKYAMDDPAGLPGHNLMLIIDKLDQLMGMMASFLTPSQIDECGAIFDEFEQVDVPPET